MKSPTAARAYLLVGLLALFLAGLGTDAQTLSLIRSNGPADKRINFLVLAEGYTTNQQATFRADATNVINLMLSATPFDLYRSGFNAWALFVASAQSGSDHADQGLYADTYFSTFYSGSGYPQLISLTSEGLMRAYNLKATYLPQADVTMILVNDLQSGGSGGSVLIGSRLGAADLLTHELGHTIAGLGDEYDDARPGYTPVEEPNTTQQTNRDLIKWKQWILPTTPIPTPDEAAYYHVTGLFEGANYQTNGWYRPSWTCRMRQNDMEFCEVCKEALVLSFYRKLRPIASYSPTNTTLLSRSPQALSFSVSRIPAPSGTPVFQWSVDGIAPPGATQTVFQVNTALLTNGSHSVSVLGRDATTLVRSDPTNALRQTQSWTLQVDIPSLRLAPLRPTASLGFGVSVTGSASQGMVLEASTNLTAWLPLATNAFTSGSYLYREPVGNALPRRYYRARAL